MLTKEERELLVRAAWECACCLEGERGNECMALLKALATLDK